MSDINTYHKNIYEDYLAHSHTWKKHIGRVENDPQDDARPFFVPKDDPARIITALYVPNDIVKVNIGFDWYGTDELVITWAEEDIPLEMLLQASKTLPSIDDSLIPSGFKAIYPIEPFIYLPPLKDCSFDPLYSEVYYIEYYEYPSKSVDKTFPYDKGYMCIDEISEDMTKLDNIMFDNICDIDAKVDRTIRKLDDVIERLDY